MTKTKIMRCISLLLLCAILLALCVWPAQAAADPADSGGSGRDEFSVTLLSTGKSDCALIYMDGLVILNDAADKDDYKAIAARLRADGVTRIDYLILSHYDKDHIGAAPRLIRKFEIGNVIRPAQIKDSEEYAALVEAEQTKGVAVTIPEEDYVIETANGQIRVDPPDTDYGDSNNNSALTWLSYRGHRLLFLGDARKARLEELLEQAEGSVDFLKLPHHGDYNTALKALIKRLCPCWAVVTAASPDELEPELEEVLNKRGVVLYNTADGPVQISWNDGALSVVQRPN